jgi:uncharacterized protein YggE
MKRRLQILGAFTLLLVFTNSAFAGEITVSGQLKKTVEPGGWLIAGDTNYLVLNAKKFQEQAWFKEAAQVEAVGETRDVMTTYMEGTPFEVSTMRPVQQTVTRSPDESRRFTRVLVSGDSTIKAQPDTAILIISVVTQARQALDAQQQNAAKSEAVIRALKSSAGSGAEVKTGGYSLQPQRIYKEGQPPTITGYEVRNSVTVTLSDLTKVGAVIDAAGQAGANDVAGISFTLKQDRPAKDTALKEATREAMSKAQVIAQALGGRVARIVEVQEDGYVRPLVQGAMVGYATEGRVMSTPIEVGSLDILSRVQLIAEIETNL